jgi:hypothetical protein
LVLVVVAAAAAVACAPPLEVPETPGYAADVEPLVLRRCLSCHRSGETRGDLVLEAGRGHQQLVGRPSVQVPFLLLVAPGEPDASYLWQKLVHTAAVGDGMPRGAFGPRRLPPEELELFRRWIETGAKP